MMQNNTQATALVVLLVATAFFIACYLLSVAQDYRRAIARDAIRYRLFAARDKLYLAAADGRLPVDGEMFQGLRDAINFMIRECDVAGFTEYIPLFIGQTEKGDDDAVAAMQHKLEQLPMPARVVYIEIVKDVHFALHDFLMLNSRIARLFNFLKHMANRMDEASAERPVTTARRLERKLQEVDRLSEQLVSA